MADEVVAKKERAVYYLRFLDLTALSALVSGGELVFITTDIAVVCIVLLLILVIRNEI